MSKKREKKDIVETQAELHSRHRPDELPPDVRGTETDSHASGAPMGGSAVGGLAGTNVGHGDPENVDIDAADGGGDFERRLDADEEQAYAGHSGGAVGGTPANKRARGGDSRRHS